MSIELGSGCCFTYLKVNRRPQPSMQQIAVPNTVANKFNATWHDERSREATIRVALRVNQN